MEEGFSWANLLLSRQHPATPPSREGQIEMSTYVGRTFLLEFFFANNPLFFGNRESISIALACLEVTSFASKQSSFTILFFSISIQRFCSRSILGFAGIYILTQPGLVLIRVLMVFLLGNI